MKSFEQCCTFKEYTQGTILVYKPVRGHTLLAINPKEDNGTGSINIICVEHAQNVLYQDKDSENYESSLGKLSLHLAIQFETPEQVRVWAEQLMCLAQLMQQERRK